MSNKKYSQRKLRVRKTVRAVADRPRLSVFRSNKFIYAQIIDDAKGKTLASFSEKKLAKEVLSKAKTKLEKASLVGEEIAKLAKKAKVTKVVFDRGGYKYHGRVKALAEGARKGGLEF